MTIEDRDPPDGNVGGDPPPHDDWDEPYPEAIIDPDRMPTAFKRAHNYGHGLFEYGESWA